VIIGVHGHYTTAPKSLQEFRDAPAAALVRLHLFTFNQLRQSERWRRAALERTGIGKPLLAG